MACNNNCYNLTDCFTCYNACGYTPNCNTCAPCGTTNCCIGIPCGITDGCYYITILAPTTTSFTSPTTGTSTLTFGAASDGWLNREGSYTINFSSPQTTTGSLKFSYAQTCCPAPSFTCPIIMTGEASGTGSLVATVTSSSISVIGTINYTYNETSYTATLAETTSSFNCCGKTRITSLVPKSLTDNSSD